MDDNMESSKSLQNKDNSGIYLSPLKNFAPTLQEQPLIPLTGSVNVDMLNPLPLPLVFLLLLKSMVVRVGGRRTILTCRKGIQGVGISLMFRIKTLILTLGWTSEPLLPLIFNPRSRLLLVIFNNLLNLLLRKIIWEVRLRTWDHLLPQILWVLDLKETSQTKNEGIH